MADIETDLLQASLARIFPAKNSVGRAFYARLFQVRPDFEAMFGDVRAQQAKFDDTIVALVRSRCTPDVFAAQVERLSHVHADLPIERADFDLVGGVLLGALDDSSPGGLTEPERRAWSDLYVETSDKILAAMDQPSAQD